MLVPFPSTLASLTFLSCSSWLAVLALGYSSCSSCGPRAGLRVGGAASPLVLVAEGWAQAQSARTPQPAETQAAKMETKYVATQSDNFSSFFFLLLLFVTFSAVTSLSRGISDSCVTSVRCWCLAKVS